MDMIQVRIFCWCSHGLRTLPESYLRPLEKIQHSQGLKIPISKHISACTWILKTLWCRTKWDGGWTSLKDASHLFTFCIFLHEYCYISNGRLCLQGNYCILKKLSFLKQWSYKKREEGWASLKDALHLSTHYRFSFLARTLLLIKGISCCQGRL